MYAREIAGRELTFGVSGKLIRNALVMYDRQTDSLWSQFLGVAVRGEFEGEALTPLAATITEWAKWRELHPETLVLDQRRTRNDSYTSYYRSESAGVVGRAVKDERLGTKEFVIGLQLDQEARAYPYRYLNDLPVINDRVSGTDVVVVFDREAGSGLVFDRTVGGRPLSFDLETSGSERGAPVLRDRETSTLWSGATGEALSGPLVGERLTQVPSFAVFWFAWIDFHPDADIFEPSTAGAG